MSAESQPPTASNADALQSAPVSSSTAPPCIAALVCSKDRAWQLDQMLHSLLLQPEQTSEGKAESKATNANAAATASHSDPPAEAASSAPADASTSTSATQSAAEFDVTVIYTCSSPAHAQSYEQLRRKWPCVHFQREEEQWTPLAYDEGVAASSSATSAASSATTPSTAFASHCVSALRRWSSLRLAPSESPRISSVLLCVDDMLLLPSDLLPWAQLCALLAQQPSLLSVQLSLHPRVDYCHPASQPAQPPMLMFPQPLPAVPTDSGSQPSASTAAAAAAAPSLPLPPSAAAALPSSSLLRFVRLLGTRDWNYPVSLCGGLYRLADVALLLRQMERLYGGRDAFSHPNKLELLANRVAQSGTKSKGALSAEEQQERATSTAAAAGTSGADAPELFLPSDWNPSSAVPLAAHRPWSACFSRPVLAVVTVNRVQDVFTNPVYTSSAGPAAAAAGPASASASTVTATTPSVDTPGPLASADLAAASEELSADELLHMWQREPSLAFDLPRYRAAAHMFRSVHIGEFFVRHDGSGSS